MIRVTIAAKNKEDVGLRAALAADDDIYLVGRARQAAELEFLLGQCDVVLITDTFADDKTTELIETITAEQQTVRVIVMGVPRRPDEILPYLEAGASDYVTDTTQPAEIIAAIHTVLAGQADISPEVAYAVMERISDLVSANPTLTGNQSNRLDILTPRQLDVLTLISQGLTNQEIADELFIQKGTVKNHVHHILKKLGVSSRHEAAEIYQLDQPATSGEDA